MTSGVSGRYASALFDLAREQNELDTVDQDLGKFQAMLDGSPDLNRLVRSPAFAAEEQERALGAVMDWASIGATTGNFLKVVTRNRRLFAAEDMIKGFRQQLALHRGEMTAEVQSATPLNDVQLAARWPGGQGRQPYVRFLATDETDEPESRAEGNRLIEEAGRGSILRPFLRELAGAWMRRRTNDKAL
jgi:ATP synthase F1 delta subunit